MTVRDTHPRGVRRARAKTRQGTRDEAPRDAHQRPLHEAVRPFLVAIAQLARRERKPPADVTFERTRSLLSAARLRLEELHAEPEDVQDVLYALVAFVDELMQSDTGPLKDFWQAHLLQLELFGETRAGEGFFDRLERAKSEQRSAVVRVYFLCLLLGFRGIYARHGELERENLIETLREALALPPSDGIEIAPFGARPHEPAADRNRNRVLQTLATSAAIMATLWYAGLSLAVDAQGRELASKLIEATADLKAGLTVSAERQ